MSKSLARRARAQEAASGDGIVFKNGVVHTVVDGAPMAQAVAVEGGAIVYVGDDAGAAAFERPGVRVVDLGGKMLMPGFVEAHIHPLVGSVIARGVDLQFDTRDEALARLRAYRDENADAEVIRGFGFRYTAFPTTGPTRLDLDAIWPDTPVIIVAIDGHSGWTNSKALEIAGITKDTPDPQPGFSFFQRDPDTNEATGWLVEVAAMFQVLMAVAPYTEEYIVAALAEWLPKASAAGITSLFDAGMILVPEEDGFAMYSEFERQGILPFRMVGSFYHFDPSIDPLPIITGLRDKYDTDLVKAQVLKINVDGGDAQRTAAMLAPYSDAPDAPFDTTILPPDVLNDTVLRADAAGLNLHFHSFGDLGIRLTLDALEQAIAANPARERRHTIAHLVVVDDADMPRFAELGVIGQFSTQWAVPDAFWAGVTSERWGERAQRTYRFGSHLRSGARLTLGTDWPAASHYSTYEPLKAIQIATTRQEIGKEATSEPLAPADERITLEEAIRGNTIDAAYQLGLDTLVGTIEVGKRADLIVLDRNLFELSPSEISSAEVVMTLMDGQVRHEQA